METPFRNVVLEVLSSAVTSQKLIVTREIKHHVPFFFETLDGFEIFGAKLRGNEENFNPSGSSPTIQPAVVVLDTPEGTNSPCSVLA
jgi:hypothetical protein